MFGMSKAREGVRGNDLRTLIGISKGSGHYATPSPERLGRLSTAGLIKKGRYGELRPTLKGWVHVMLNR